MPFSYCKFYLLSFLSLCPVECGWFKLFVTFKCLQSHHIVIACRVEAPITNHFKILCARFGEVQGGASFSCVGR